MDKASFIFHMNHQQTSGKYVPFGSGGLWAMLLSDVKSQVNFVNNIN